MLKIICRESNLADLKRLFSPFLVRCREEERYSQIEVSSRYIPSQIAPIINPLLAKNEIWGFHGAGVIHEKGALVFLGKSGTGKSTLIQIFLRLGLKIIGDDIILMKDTEEGIDVLPFFCGIQAEDKSSIRTIPYSSFSSGRLSNIFILSGIGDKTVIKGPIPKASLKREIYENMLWALDESIIRKQLVFVEKLILTEGYYMTPGHDIFKRANLVIEHIEKVFNTY